MIPVLICPTVSRFDLLEKMVASIDHPVARLVIVDNSLTGYVIQTENANVQRIDYIRPLVGLGYPGGINAGITQTPSAPWWAWTNNDILFGPSDLAHVAEVMDAATGPRHITGTARRLRNAYGASNRAAIDAVGLFDEWSFYPIYFDDDDFERRNRLGGVEWIAYDGGITHVGSATIHSDPKAQARNSVTFMDNRQRYIDKWGGLPERETFTLPWGDKPLNYCPVDMAGRAKRLW